MLYFVTMRRMQDMPEVDTSATFLYPCNGKLHFAIIYSAHPSSSKPFQYKVFCKHVDPHGKAMPGTPLYGLFGCKFGFLDECSLQKIASIMNMFICKASDGSMWYEYESHSMPDGSFCDVRNWALLMKNYSRFIDINISELDAEPTSNFSDQFKVSSEHLNQTVELFGAIPEMQLKKRSQEKESTTGKISIESLTESALKKPKQLYSTEAESLDFSNVDIVEPTTTQLVDDSWAVPDGFFEDIGSFDPLL